MTLTTLFAMGLAMTSPPIVVTKALSSFGKYTLVPRWPISVETKAPSVATDISDPGIAHYAAAHDPQRRRMRVFTLEHEEERAGWIDVMSLWEQSGFGSKPLQFDVPGSSPVETINVVFDGEPVMDTQQSSFTVYSFTVRLLELVHRYPGVS
jgi:hypothetical protein